MGFVDAGAPQSKIPLDCPGIVLTLALGWAQQAILHWRRGEQVMSEDRRDEQRDTLEQAEPSELGQEQLLEQLRQLSADFENFRKRSGVQVQEAARKGQDQMLEELIPLLTDLGSVTRQPLMPDQVGVRRGIEMILEKGFGILAGLGYQRVATTGLTLDPRRHEALLTIASDSVPSGQVLEELAPGFERDGKVVIAAKVAVARGE
jgi:molecular chaperone GrpE